MRVVPNTQILTMLTNLCELLTKLAYLSIHRGSALPKFQCSQSLRCRPSIISFSRNNRLTCHLVGCRNKPHSKVNSTHASCLGTDALTPHKVLLSLEAEWKEHAFKNKRREILVSHFHCTIVQCEAFKIASHLFHCQYPCNKVHRAYSLIIQPIYGPTISVNRSTSLVESVCTTHIQTVRYPSFQLCQCFYLLLLHLFSKVSFLSVCTRLC